MNWLWYLFIQLFAKLCNRFLYVVLHEQWYSPISWKVYVHSYKFVLLHSWYGKFTKIFWYCLNSTFVHVFENMQYFVVVNIPRYCTLFTLYVAVCYIPTMYWSQTHVISEYSQIGHTIIARTKCNRTNFSIVRGILP